MRRYQLNIPAGSELEIFASGDYVRVHQAGVALTVREPDRNQEVELQEGDDAHLARFRRLRFSHGATSDQTAIVYIGDGTQASSARIGGAVDIKQGTTLSASSVSVGSTATQLVAASSTRKSVRFQNLGTEAVYLGPSGVTTANGIKLDPGATWIEDNGAAAAWYAIAATGPVDVRVQEIAA